MWPPRKARLKPRLGPAPEAAILRPFTGRRRVASSLAPPGRRGPRIGNLLVITSRPARTRSTPVPVRNLRLTEELLSLVELFDREGIRALPLKGPVLATVA